MTDDVNVLAVTFDVHRIGVDERPIDLGSDLAFGRLEVGPTLAQRACNSCPPLPHARMTADGAQSGQS